MQVCGLVIGRCKCVSALVFVLALAEQVVALPIECFTPSIITYFPVCILSRDVVAVCSVMSGVISERLL